MAAFKNEKNGTWEQEFLRQKRADFDMTFESFVKIYMNDMKNRIREHTWQTKISIIETKLLPYFKDKKMCEIDQRILSSGKMK